MSKKLKYFYFSAFDIEMKVTEPWKYMLPSVREIWSGEEENYQILRKY